MRIWRLSVDVRLFHRRAQGRILTNKPVVAQDGEAEGNPRSRSAKLRVFEKRGGPVDEPADGADGGREEKRRAKRGDGGGGGAAASTAKSRVGAPAAAGSASAIHR